MNKSTGEERDEGSRRQRNNLDGRYGEIGISAVAAAVRYKGESRNPAYALDERATANAYGYLAEA